MIQRMMYDYYGVNYYYDYYYHNILYMERYAGNEIIKEASGIRAQQYPIYGNSIIHGW